MKKEFNIKWIYLFILIVVGFLTIGYATIDLDISIENLVANIRMEKDIRVTSISVDSSTSESVSNYENYNVSSVYGNITLPNEDSTITYKVQVTNIEGPEMGILDITGLDENLKYELTGYSLEEKLCDENNNCSLGSVAEFYITLKYDTDGYNSDNITYTFEMNFDFRSFHTVTYTSFTNDSQYKVYVMDGADFSQTFSEEINGIDVKMGGFYISDLTFSNSTITIPDVSGDIEIINLEGLTFLSGIELNYVIKNATYAPEGDIYEYYSVDANRAVDETVKKIIFGKKSDYINEVSSVVAQPIDVNKTGTISLYRITDTDGKLIIYVLSDDGKFILNSNASWMFDKLYALEEIVNLHLLDTTRVTQMRDMFCDCAALKNIDLSNFDTSSVTNMVGMFARTLKLNYIDISSFDIQNVTLINQMFSGSMVKTIYVSSDWKLPSTVEDHTGMFSGCTNLVGGNGTVYDKTIIDGTRAVIDGTSAGYLTSGYKFDTGINVNHAIKAVSAADREVWKLEARYGDTTITSLTFGKTRDYQEVVSGYIGEAVDGEKSGAITVYRIPNGSNYSVYILSNSGTFIANEDSAWFFDSLKMLTSINNLYMLNTSKVTNMRDMFCDCQMLPKVDLSGFDTRNTTSMEGMFARMYKIQTLDLSSFNTSKTTNMKNMFVLSISTTETLESLLNVIPALTTIYVSNSWTTANVTVETVLANNVNLVGGAGTVFSSNNVSTTYLRVDGGTSSPGYLTLK